MSQGFRSGFVLFLVCVCACIWCQPDVQGSCVTPQSQFQQAYCSWMLVLIMSSCMTYYMVTSKSLESHQFWCVCNKRHIAAPSQGHTEKLVKTYQKASRADFLTGKVLVWTIHIHTRTSPNHTGKIPSSLMLNIPESTKHIPRTYRTAY